jgi:hypothetical protein
MLFLNRYAAVDAKQVNFLLSGLNPRAGESLNPGVSSVQG